MGILIQGIASGILLGAVYALFSIGLSLIYGVMDIINFAHGEYIMLAMYGAYFSWSLLGIDPLLSIFLLTPLFFIFGMLTHRVIIEPILDAPVVIQIVPTLGLWIIFTNLAQLLFSPNVRTIRTWYKDTSLQLGMVHLNYAKLISFGIAVVATIMLHLFLKKTRYGLAIRATMQNKVAAQLFGMEPRKIYMVAFGIGIALTGIAGVCLSTMFSIFPTVGFTFVIIAFVVAVTGGLGSINGCFYAGIFLGLVYSLVGIYLNPTLSNAATYAIFVIAVVLRASGQLGNLSNAIQGGLGKLVRRRVSDAS